MAQFVDMEKLEEFGKSLHDYAETNIRDEIDALLNLWQKYNWEGPAKDAYFKQYKEIMTALYEYSDMIEKLGYFLRYVADGYNNVRDESGELFKRYIEELEAEKKKNKDYLWKMG